MKEKFSRSLTEEARRLFEEQFGQKLTDDQAQNYLGQLAALGSLLAENVDRLKEDKSKAV